MASASESRFVNDDKVKQSLLSNTTSNTFYDTIPSTPSTSTAPSRSSPDSDSSHSPTAAAKMSDPDSSTSNLNHDEPKTSTEIEPSPNANPESEPEGLKVIHVSFYRMSTASFASAYRSLGYKVHHGLDHSPYDLPWAQLEAAAEATFALPTALPVRYNPFSTSSSTSMKAEDGVVMQGPKGKGFGRTDWETLFPPSAYDILTDTTTPFTHSLLAAYPSAKVVIVTRPFALWYPSFASQILDPVFPVRLTLKVRLVCLAMMLTRSRAWCGFQKVLLGFFGARDRAEIEERAEMVMREFFEEVRRRVPEERRVEFCVGGAVGAGGRDGEGGGEGEEGGGEGVGETGEQMWRRLCAFLDKPLPLDERGELIPFPRTNDRKELEERRRVHRRKFLVKGMFWVGVWAVGVVVAAWLVWGRG
ncbi:hypothetical protein CC80DRAFT_532444 [Byssothecium circinans]|uniref:Uncharacterized protein n=1 Tax=Byssothecium circinans TaxID=147558 RepID=A0A6A5UDA6_9PLEO|nr:hypothetical protein CC80DRAFT_532444 [Byssothecium circinans]